MALTGFEPVIPASEWPQNHTLDRAAMGIGMFSIKQHYFDYLTTLTVSEIVQRPQMMNDILGKKLVGSDLTLTGVLTQNLRGATETKLTTTPTQDIRCPC